MFKSIRKSLSRTRQSVFGQIQNALGNGDITEETYEDLEALLIQADMGVDTSLFIVEQVRDRAVEKHLYRADQLIPELRGVLRAILIEPPPLQIDTPRLLTIVMVVGVNGSGKTTSIGKLAKYYKGLGRRVQLVAGDTFRAAAIDQLKVWGDRAGVPVISGQPGGDPAAVIYDSIRATRARGYDLLFVDTAGRLHTKFNLMKELEKVYSVCQKSVHQAPHEVLLVLDAPTGQNALLQAIKFKESVHITGVVLTKLDGTGKGGMVFAIYRELGVPVRFIGTGEGIDDIAPFDADAFIDGLFDEPPA
ncbi:MAG: signal recognition particle-docking protein FtsY [Anaerolineae bacterium]|nr:signal recognition particle-docking protein FtsY [Anaerolineae bacterium]MCO5187799.1 signal recognition particle-docking protein FtsY [Anaerolineae bacterium]MCO5191896.1 signal recognition particle-docking protein FtsY [Anaerolineae bacterium]MCO5197714.1 signal recognition particle-docking protein FtsY [Anaerolineae bacterium]MCO5206639.1 signal recognition particle-docking protein FtsY [Anaerolineae bacterium]